jgi:uncharacterized protein (DUF58 family)
MSAGRLAQELGYSPEFLNQLRALVLQNKRMLPGPGAGRRRSPRAGSSVELMDYRNYVPGDDLRRLDWNVLARLVELGKPEVPVRARGDHGWPCLRCRDRKLG